MHFHVIPKPAATDEEGLVIEWPAKSGSIDELRNYYEDILSMGLWCIRW